MEKAIDIKLREILSAKQANPKALLWGAHNPPLVGIYFY